MRSVYHAEILRVLAKHRDLRPYQITQTIADERWTAGRGKRPKPTFGSSVYYCLKQLENKNYVESSQRDKWRTGKETRKYRLTFLGFLRVLSQSESGPSHFLKTAVTNYANIFSDIPLLEPVVRPLENMASAARVCFVYPPPAAWNAITFGTLPQTVKPLIETFARAAGAAKIREITETQKREQVAAFKTAYAEAVLIDLFQRLQACVKPVRIKRAGLRVFIEKICGAKLQGLDEERRRIQGMRAELMRAVRD